MKKITKYFSCIILAALLANETFAQTSGVQQDQTYPRVLEDKSASERLQKDWKKRNSTIQNQPVQWFDLGEGFYGSYTNDNTKYMALYDEDGNYVQTFRKTDWNNVPATASIKSSYDLSNYKSQEVSSFWEVSDPNMKGYYFEIADDKGKVSHVWANETGEFSTTVPKAKTKF